MHPDKKTHMSIHRQKQTPALNTDSEPKGKKEKDIKLRKNLTLKYKNDYLLPKWLHGLMIKLLSQPQQMIMKIDFRDIWLIRFLLHCSLKKKMH